jgi:Zn-dependent peptidase ImmA (M78 family)
MDCEWLIRNPIKNKCMNKTKPNAARIPLARNLRGVLQGELSILLKQSNQSIISNLETGKAEFTDEHVLQISKALGLPPSFFYKDKNFTRLSKFYYRKRNAFNAAQLVPLEAKIDVIRSIYTELLKSVDIQSQELPAIPVSDRNSPQQIADTFRLFLNMGEEPIINLVHLIEKLGIPIIFLDVESDKFSGMTLQTDINQSIIVVNKNMPNDHKKFTIAHELGHLIMHIPFSEDVNFLNQLEDFEAVEKQADQFAGAFLIPASQAKYQFRNLTYSKLADFKIYWKVSKQAIIYRAKDVGAISETKFKSLFIELSRFGERKREKHEIDIDKPTLFNKVVDVHEKSLGFTRKRIAEELGGITESDFNNWFGYENNSKLRIVLN